MTRVKDVLVAILAVAVIVALLPVEWWVMHHLTIEDGPVQGWGHPWTWLSNRIERPGSHDKEPT